MSDRRGNPVRELILKPRRIGYTHRPLCTWAADTLRTEGGLLITDPRDVIAQLADLDGPVIATHDAGGLLALVQAHGDLGPDAPLELVVRLTDVGPDQEGVPYVSKARISNIGWKLRDGVRGRKRRLGLILDPERVIPGPADQPANTHDALLGLAWDLREWCREHDLPIRTTSPGLSNALMRSRQMAPHGFARIPQATNEKLRPHLPGVHYQDGPDTSSLGVYRSLTSLDQKRAYHRIAQSVPLPDPRTLYARGYFEGAGNKLWLTPGVLMETVLSQPGMVIARVRATRKPEHFAPPTAHAAWKGREGVDGVDLPVWTVEIPSLRECGCEIIGVRAAWTSFGVNDHLPGYATAALAMIDEATPARRRWLKATLHSGYGMLGARPRALRMATTSQGPGGAWEVWGIAGRPVRVRVIDLAACPPPTSNVAALGVLQAAVTDRSLALARAYQREGMDVTRVHADAIHVASEQLPLVLPEEWEPTRLTGVSYLDAVSWTSDQKNVLPGRPQRGDKAHTRRELSEQMRSLVRASNMRKTRHTTAEE